jgi:hypothetical protein
VIINVTVTTYPIKQLRLIQNPKLFITEPGTRESIVTVAVVTLLLLLFSLVCLHVQ